jgi:excisionase family DNA binding protein
MFNVEKRWISPREAALYLGVHIMTIYSWIAAEKIPAARIGRLVRVDLKALEGILQSQVEGRPPGGRLKGRAR